VKKARGKARHLAVQAIYQWQLNADSLAQIQADFILEHDLTSEVESYFSNLVSGIASHQASIDATLEKFADRSVEQIDPIERAILRLGVYELQERLDVPYRVSLNEWINLAKKFGAPRSHAYVNGILDKASIQLRAIEINAANV
jgi:N utilization substance protein B